MYQANYTYTGRGVSVRGGNSNSSTGKSTDRCGHCGRNGQHGGSGCNNVECQFYSKLGIVASSWYTLINFLERGNGNKNCSSTMGQS